MPAKAYEGLEDLEVDLVIEDTSKLKGQLKTMVGDTFTKKGIVSTANMAYWINEGPFLDVTIYRFQNESSIKAAINVLKESEIATKINTDADLAFELESEYGNQITLFVDDVRLTIVSFSTEIDIIAFSNVYVDWIHNHQYEIN